MVIWKEAITIFSDRRYAIEIHLIEKTLLQFSIYHSHVILYLFHIHRPTCQVMYFPLFLCCPWEHMDKGSYTRSPSAPSLASRLVGRHRRRPTRATTRLLPPPSVRTAAFLCSRPPARATGRKAPQPSVHGPTWQRRRPARAADLRSRPPTHAIGRKGP